MRTFEEDVLAYNPFGDDFGTPSDLTFSDRMVIARKDGTCHDCEQPILKGTRIRSLRCKFDGNMRTYRFCYPCCCAMAASWFDSGLALQHRADLLWAGRRGRG